MMITCRAAGGGRFRRPRPAPEPAIIWFDLAVDDHGRSGPTRPYPRRAVRRKADPVPATPAARAQTVRPTLREVAMLAGVSAKTASRVINAEPGVSPSKVDAVQRAIAQLNYRPNFT